MFIYVCCLIWCSVCVFVFFFLYFFIFFLFFFFFFFSSRRRHTRCGRDWGSDVCSSDLRLPQGGAGRRDPAGPAHRHRGVPPGPRASGGADPPARPLPQAPRLRVHPPPDLPGPPPLDRKSVV